MRSIFFASAFADAAKAMLPAKDQVSLSIDFMSTLKRDEGAASSEISDAYFGEMFKVEQTSQYVLMKPEEKSRYKQLRCVNFVDASADFDYRKNTLFRDRVEQGMQVPGYKGWGWLLGGQSSGHSDSEWLVDDGAVDDIINLIDDLPGLSPKKKGEHLRFREIDPELGLHLLSPLNG